MNFFRALLSQNGKISSNRFFALIIIVFLIISSGVVAWQTGAIPDIGMGWLGLVTALVSASLGGKAVEGFAKNKPSDESETPKEQQ